MVGFSVVVNCAVIVPQTGIAPHQIALTVCLCDTQASSTKGAQCRVLQDLARGTLLSSLPPDSIILQVRNAVNVLL